MRTPGWELAEIRENGKPFIRSSGYAGDTGLEVGDAQISWRSSQAEENNGILE